MIRIETCCSECSHMDIRTKYAKKTWDECSLCGAPVRWKEVTNEAYDVFNAWVSSQRDFNPMSEVRRRDVDGSAELSGYQDFDED